ncbi:hypothetical protein [Marinoscillum sp.]|uniref:hypothetical protein n=1 Tax=Marinoscillum sp. TaxID=2024838 RepID=UPI0032FF511E
MKLLKNLYFWPWRRILEADSLFQDRQQLMNLNPVERTEKPEQITFENLCSRELELYATEISAPKGFARSELTSRLIVVYSGRMLTNQRIDR